MGTAAAAERLARACPQGPFDASSPLTEIMALKSIDPRRSK